MRRELFVALLSMEIAACAQQGTLAVRPLPSLLAQGDRPVSYRVAEAAGQFALGNVALALESYRKALRDEPDSIAALIGRAACYEAFGRFDMSRQDYETALALAPADERLLAIFASSLLRQGRAEEAAAVRAEIDVRRGALGTSGSAPVRAPLTVPMPVAREASSLSITVAPARVEPALQAAPALASVRLERLSLGEVALVTSRVGPVERATRPTAARQSSLLPLARFAASLRPDPTVPSPPASRPILLLNAARSEGLASRARRYLEAQGFGTALIGNASGARERTLIIAPRREQRRALQLARSFAIRPRMIVGARLMVLLGRDALRAPSMRS